MAYMSQEKKAMIQQELKPILKKYSVKGSLSVKHHSTLVLNIASGPIDFIGDLNEHEADKHYHNPLFTPVKNCLNANPYWYKEHFTGASLNFLEEVMPVLNNENFDKSDIQSDYFHVGWYVDVNIGKWDKPYKITV